MAALPYMPLYVADYLADTAHLSALEHGAYLMLIMNYWQRGKPLPDDDRKLARIARVDMSDWPSVREAIAEFFDCIDGEWRHGRIESELAHVHMRSEKAKASAQRSVSARSAKAKRTLSERSPTVELTDTDTEEEKGDDARATVDYRALGNRLFAAAGSSVDRTNAGLEIMSTPVGWIQQGCDLDTDIIPTIREVAARSPPGSIRSWSYFSRAVADAKATRTRPIPEGKPIHVKPARNRLTAAFDQVDANIAAARARNHERSGQGGSGEPVLRVASDL